MRIKNEYMKICGRFSSVMWDIGCEHLSIPDGAVSDDRKYYDVEDGVTIRWMRKEAEYWLSCYYENGNVRCDDRFIDEDNYKLWVSETGKLKRLIKALEKYDDCICVEEL